MARLAGVPAMCAAMLLWPIVETLASMLSRPYSAVEVVWVRYGTHLALMLLLWSRVGPARLVRTRRPGVHVLRGLTMLGMPLTFVVGITRLPVDVVMSVFWIAPLLAMLVAAVWMGERAGRRQWAAAFAAYAGVLLILRPSTVPRTAVVWPLAMAGCFALYQVLTRFLREETTGARLFYTALAVWLPLSVAVPWVWKTPTLRDLALMMSIGVLGFLFLLGLDRALDAAALSRLAPFALAQPLWTVLIAATLTGRWPPRAALVGIVVVLVAWLVFAWPGREAGTPTLRSG